LAPIQGTIGIMFLTSSGVRLGHLAWTGACLLLASWGCECDSTTPAAGGAGTTTSGTTATGSGGTGGTGGGGTAIGGGGQGGALGPPPDYCTVCESPTSSGTLANGAINETSGLMASHAHAGVFFLHNDSGDSPRFFAIDSAGADQGTFDVTGAQAQDWEDAARGPCPAGSCLFFGDVGDNAEARGSYAVYRVPEPSSVGVGTHTATADAFPFVYPDGSHNCETLLVHPTTGQMVVVTKVGSGSSGVYRFPDSPTVGQTSTLIHVTDVTPAAGGSQFTAGDVHPAGHGVLLRTYGRLFFYPMAVGESIGDALGSTPCELPVASEGQGEAVAWTDSGDGYVTVSEGAGSAVNSADCPAGP